MLPRGALGRQVYTDELIPAFAGGAYLASDVVGGLLTFVLKPRTPSLILTAARLTDDDKTGFVYTLHLFNAKPAVTIANNAPFTLSAADASKRFAVLTFDTWNDLGGANQQILDLAIITRLVEDFDYLYAYLTSGTGYTPATGSLILSLDAADMF